MSEIQAPRSGVLICSPLRRVEEIAHLRLARGVLHYECNEVFTAVQAALHDERREVFTASGSEYQNKVKNALVRIEKKPPLRGRIEKNSPCGE